MKSFSQMWKAGAVAVSGVTLPIVVAAATNPFDNAGKMVTDIGGNAGLGAPKTLPEIFGSIINVALGFLGVVLLAYLLYAGFLWMTSGGESKKADEAKVMIRNAIIGLIIIVAAFSISQFVLTSLIGATQG